MRPGQQNKRMRGRGRRGPNPMSRSYESNGPDVKVRGTAAHIAEKYMQLARDAHASGDPVMAESYLQHAEHYFRIIAAAQLQQNQQQGGDVQQPPQRYNGGGRYDSADIESDEATDQPHISASNDDESGRHGRSAQAEPQSGSQDGSEGDEQRPEKPAPRRRRRRASDDQPADQASGADKTAADSPPTAETPVHSSESRTEGAEA